MDVPSALRLKAALASSTKLKRHLSKAQLSIGFGFRKNRPFEPVSPSNRLYFQVVGHSSQLVPVCYIGSGR